MNKVGNLLDQSTSIASQFEGAFSIGSGKRSTNFPLNGYPGPGAYNINVGLQNQKVKGVSFSKCSDQTNKPKKKVSYPSVGQYDVLTNDGIYKGISFAKSSRNSDPPVAKNKVGPTTYDPKLSSVKSAASLITFAYRQESEFFKVNRDNPGPGTYNVKSNQDIQQSLKKKQNTQLGSEKKISIKQIDQRSPCDYNPKLPNINSASWKFPKSPRFKSNKLQDSSQTVVNQDSLDKLQAQQHQNAKGFSFGIKPNLIKTTQADVPAPNYYDNLSFFKKNNEVTFSKSLRPQLSYNNDTPSPDQYQSLDFMNSVQKKANIMQVKNRYFGTSSRKPLTENNISPSPQAYNIPSKIGEGPKISIKFQSDKNQWEVGSNLPGPGQYNASDSIISKNSAKVSFGGKQAENYKNNLPGPGSYNVSKTDLYSNHQASFSGKQNQSTDYKFLFEPGPGSYEIKPTFAAIPQYLLNKKINQNYL